MPGAIWSRYLSDDGTTTGNKSAIGDYSGAAEEWYLEAAAGQRLHVHRLLIGYEDAGGGTAEEYGNIGSALTNGIELEVRDEDDVVEMDLTDSVPIKSNGQWAVVCHDAQRKDWGAGDDLYTVRWTFAKAGDDILLQPGWKLVVKLNDSFVGLVSHYFLAQGHY